MSEQLKFCPDCTEYKVISEFYFHKKQSGSCYKKECKKCTSARVKAWRIANPEKYDIQRGYARAYRKQGTPSEIQTHGLSSAIGIEHSDH